jgi:hypothetical protein
VLSIEVRRHSTAVPFTCFLLLMVAKRKSQDLKFSFFCMGEGQESRRNKDLVAKAIFENKTKQNQKEYYSVCILRSPRIYSREQIGRSRPLRIDRRNGQNEVKKSRSRARAQEAQKATELKIQDASLAFCFHSVEYSIAQMRKCTTSSFLRFAFALAAVEKRERAPRQLIP